MATWYEEEWVGFVSGSRPESIKKDRRAPLEHMRETRYSNVRGPDRLMGWVQQSGTTSASGACSGAAWAFMARAETSCAFTQNFNGNFHVRRQFAPPAELNEDSIGPDDELFTSITTLLKRNSGHLDYACRTKPVLGHKLWNSTTHENEEGKREKVHNRRSGALALPHTIEKENNTNIWSRRLSGTVTSDPRPNTTAVLPSTVPKPWLSHSCTAISAS